MNHLLLDPLNPEMNVLEMIVSTLVIMWCFGNYLEITVSFCICFLLLYCLYISEREHEAILHVAGRAEIPTRMGSKLFDFSVFCLKKYSRFMRDRGCNKAINSLNNCET